MTSNNDGNKQPLTYRDAGVDIDAGNAFVDMIKPFAKGTRRPGADSDLGGFGGLFDLKAAGFKDPILVAANDGVGTKVKIAIETGIHDTIGIDLVAMCVNDLVVQGAEPLFFLDYLATAKLELETATNIIKGIAQGCEMAGCALIGGETAEMPGMYQGKDYDLAGFSVGAAERGKLLPRGDIQVGDNIIGLASSGIHSNGYSLVRKLIEQGGHSYSDPAPFAGDYKTLGAALLEPTRIYVKALLSAARQTGAIKALAHITGGGLTENIPRVLPDGLSAAIDLDKIIMPPVMTWLRQEAALDETEMLKTFNCGIGMVVICAADECETLLKTLHENGETAGIVGQIHEMTGAPDVTYEGELKGFQ